MPIKRLLSETYSENDILASAANILEEKFTQTPTFSSAADTKSFLHFKMAALEHETFCIMHLNSQHHLIEFEELFRGTINAAAVYPREVVKSVLAHNASAVILVHNHPSGIPEPSESDKTLTRNLKAALALIDVPVLDHVVVGKDCVSFAERGLL